MNMDLPRYHRLRSAYYRLEGQRCADCNVTQFPPRATCRACRGARLQSEHLSGRGSVYSYAEVNHAPRGFQAPYLVGLVRLDEGPLVTAQLTDLEPEDARIGLPVEMVTRRLQERGAQGLLVYGYKFRPVLAGASAS